MRERAAYGELTAQDVEVDNWAMVEHRPWHQRSRLSRRARTHPSCPPSIADWFATIRHPSDPTFPLFHDPATRHRSDCTTRREASSTAITAPSPWSTRQGTRTVTASVVDRGRLPIGVSAWRLPPRSHDGHSQHNSNRCTPWKQPPATASRRAEGRVAAHPNPITGGYSTDLLWIRPIGVTQMRRGQ